MLTQELETQIRAIFAPLGNLHRVYLFEQMPAAKLGNAKSRFAQLVGSDESRILLYDDTFWGSGKDGFLLTTKRVYGRNIADSSSFLEVADIADVTFVRNALTPSIRFQSRSGPALEKHITMSNQEKQANTLVTAVRQTIELLQSGGSGTPVVANPQTGLQEVAICGGCGATGPVGTKCKWCRRAIKRP